ncbi:hypothetical protein BDR03DRAFT_954998 [Suillus americanus]|nr:hypothetical protein BDR03DRAFT_954998 [Suillus americanus]
MHSRLFGSSHRAKIWSRLLPVASGSSLLENIAQLVSAVVIILEHSFYVFDKRRYLQDQQESVPSFYVSLEQYIASPHAAAVREAVIAAVQAYQEAMKTPVERKMPAWMAKFLFERFQKEKEAKEKEAKQKEAKQKESLAKAELTKAILEISLNHRLPRP